MPETEKKTAGHNPIAVANRFIEISLEKKKKGLYLLPLIKLPYIAHGLTLAITDQPLCDEKVEVWQHGPVFPSIFYAFKAPKRVLRDKLAVIYTKEYPFSDDENEIINLTFEKYGGKDSTELSNLTHGNGTPWRRAYDKGLEIITNDSIKNYYKEIISAE